MKKMCLEIYEKNIQALYKVNHISLIKSLEAVDLNNQDNCIVFEGNEKSTKVLKIKTKSNYILYNSFYNPLKEAKEITKHLDYDVNRSLITAIGVGMGYHLKEILEKLNEKSILLTIEYDEIILKNLLWHIDFSDSIEQRKVFFALVDKEESIYKEILAIIKGLFLNIHSIQTVILPLLDLPYIKFSKNVLKYLSDLRTSFEFTLGNDLDDTVDGVINRLHNLPQIIKNPGLKQLLENYKDVYENKPAIIIASGPSLDKNIHLLKEAKGKALLLACDGSMESLKKHNIVPDIVSSVERILLTYEAFYKDKKMPDDTVLVAPAVVRPEIFNSFNNKTLSLFKSEPIANYFNEMVCDKGTVFSGVSVAHQLMGIAVALGASPIILVGQDLAYSTDGVSHTSEASVKEKVNVRNIELFVKGTDGKDVPTTFVWKQFKQIYEQYISSLNIDCIDATEGGAFIEGTKTMTLKEAIDRYCLIEVPKFRDLVDSLNVENAYIIKAYHNSLVKTTKLAKKFHLLKLRSIKSIELNNQAQKMIEKGLTNDDELDFIYDALDYTENKIVKYITNNAFLTMTFQYPITLAVKQINELGSKYTLESIQANLEVHVKLLQTIDFYCLKVLRVLEEGFDFIKSSAHEINNEENIYLDEIKYPEYLKKMNYLDEKGEEV